MNSMKLCLLTLIEKHPAVGYLGAAVPTSAGFWVLIQQATQLLALVSILIGIAVGLATWRVQRMQARKLEQEERK